MPKPCGIDGQTFMNAAGSGFGRALCPTAVYSIQKPAEKP
jgi:hypothetical protein